MYIFEGIVGILLVQVFAFDVETAGFIVGTDVVGLHTYFFRLYALHAQCQVQSFGEEKLGFGGVVHFFVPFFLVGQSGTVEKSPFHGDWYIGGQGISHCESHVPYIAHLLGDERAVGEVLLVRRAVGVDGEGDTHLSGGDCQSFCREKPGVGIQHLDLAFVGEVYLGFVGYAGQYVARHADAGIAYFETSCTHGGLIFVFGADGSVDFRQVVFGFHLLLFNLFSVLVDGGRLGNCGQRQQGN